MLGLTQPDISHLINKSYSQVNMFSCLPNTNNLSKIHESYILGVYTTRLQKKSHQQLKLKFN